MIPPIQHDKANQRFFIELPEGTCELNYRIINDTTLDYCHTFVPPTLRNRGLAALLVQYALDYAKQQNMTVIPSCPYVASYLRRHP